MTFDQENLFNAKYNSFPLSNSIVKNLPSIRFLKPPPPTSHPTILSRLFQLATSYVIRAPRVSWHPLLDLFLVGFYDRELHNDVAIWLPWWTVLVCPVRLHRLFIISSWSSLIGTRLFWATPLCWSKGSKFCLLLLQLSSFFYP